jgi:hypothetical protein
MNGLLLDALYAKYRADKADAVARLDIYLNNSVGIGEHPQHTEEMDKIVEKFADAQDKLESLKMMISHVANNMPDQDKKVLKG